jgi:hypothetical protein
MIFGIYKIPEASNGRSTVHRTPHGVALISQTCDVVLPKTTTVTVAAVVQLPDGEARQARTGARPRYISLPARGDSVFADLDHVATVAKSDLHGVDLIEGLPEGDLPAERKFAFSVGRRYSRYPFPDEIVPWLEPLRSSVLNADHKVNSPLHPAIAKIQELRLQASSWDTFPTDLTLHVLVEADELPEVGDDLPQPTADIRNFLSVPRNPGEVAGRLFPPTGERPEGDDRLVLWNALGDAFARLCKISDADIARFPSAEHTVRSVDALVSSDDDFTLAQLRRSERLDLAHLSPPTPHSDSSG